MQRLQSDGCDRRIAIAKQWGHDTVDNRHVFFAVAHVLALPVPEKANAILQPRGEALSAPAFDDRTAAIVENCTSEAAALALFTTLAGEFDISIDEQPMTSESTAMASRTVETETLEQPPAQREVGAMLDDLHSLIGLESVRQCVEQLVHLHRLNQEREQRGLPTMQPGMNLMFTGSPGTGKMTVSSLGCSVRWASCAVG